MKTNLLANQPKTKEQSREAFVQEYNALCAKFALQLAAAPGLTKRDDGTYSITVQWVVIDAPKASE